MGLKGRNGERNFQRKPTSLNLNSFEKGGGAPKSSTLGQSISIA